MLKDLSSKLEHAVAMAAVGDIIASTVISLESSQTFVESLADERSLIVGALFAGKDLYRVAKEIYDIVSDRITVYTGWR